MFKSPLLKSQRGLMLISFTDQPCEDFPQPTGRPPGPRPSSYFAVVFTANNNSCRFQQVQTTTTQVKPDAVTSDVATAIFAGKTAEFTGVQKINLNTGETTLQSHNVSGAARDAICERLPDLRTGGVGAPTGPLTH